MKLQQGTQERRQNTELATLGADVWSSATRVHQEGEEAIVPAGARCKEAMTCVYTIRIIGLCVIHTLYTFVS